MTGWLLSSSSAVLAAPTSQELQPAALNVLVPIQDVAQVAAGGSHTCILTTSGGADAGEGVSTGGSKASLYPGSLQLPSTGIMTTNGDVIDGSS